MHELGCKRCSSLQRGGAYCSFRPWFDPFSQMRLLCLDQEYQDGPLSSMNASVSGTAIRKQTNSSYKAMPATRSRCAVNCNQNSTFMLRSLHHCLKIMAMYMELLPVDLSSYLVP